MTVVAIILMLGGAFFLMVSCIGLIRLPDFYTRNHAVGKAETLGTILTLLGLIVYNGLAITSLKVLIILLFVGIANPTATHALLKAAFSSGLQPWTRKGRQNSGKPEDTNASTKTEGGRSRNDLAN
jgi:multicomponent Na+:H+ antiporter subunit G